MTRAIEIDVSPQLMAIEMEEMLKGEIRWIEGEQRRDEERS